MTIKLEKSLQDNPPRQPLDNLVAILEDWNWRFAPQMQPDEIVDQCRQCDNVDEAVAVACLIHEKDTADSRVKMDIRWRFAHLIMREIDQLEFRDFDDLHDWLVSISPNGIGPATAYDVSVRLAAFLKLERTSLYLKQDVRIAWNKLHGTRRVPEVKGRVPCDMLPEELSQLTADQAEDVLCRYQSIFKPWLKK